ncbi:unnamed protein product [Vitrella brassicaformis CCMP3155]|uniref:RING-type E3 ubiquitin transferase BRCA1 n=1 Tax=Vitrella brassicaformis (strain CCMP3155) TaxID=1169540 RepID=A0A0G4E8J7_VITBC|nr:unnamed protein product [Vitrella brassicaformis CCMP3155]|eukprot:CEL92114.1 unnamed protein product [Vitrella brassicaformis CCMP3155]
MSAGAPADASNEDTIAAVLPQRRQFHTVLTQYCQQAEPNLKCPICDRLFDDPRAGPCSHFYCRECILAHIHIRCECPVCRNYLCPRDLRKIGLLERMVTAFTALRQLLDNIPDEPHEEAAAAAHDQPPMQLDDGRDGNGADGEDGHRGEEEEAAPAAAAAAAAGPAAAAGASSAAHMDGGNRRVVTTQDVDAIERDLAEAQPLDAKITSLLLAFDRGEFSIPPGIQLPSTIPHPESAPAAHSEPPGEPDAAAAPARPQSESLPPLAAASPPHDHHDDDDAPPAPRSPPSPSPSPPQAAIDDEPPPPDDPPAAQEDAPAQRDGGSPSVIVDSNGQEVRAVDSITDLLFASQPVVLRPRRAVTSTGPREEPPIVIADESRNAEEPPGEQQPEEGQQDGEKAAEGGEGADHDVDMEDPRQGDEERPDNADVEDIDEPVDRDRYHGDHDDHDNNNRASGGPPPHDDEPQGISPILRRHPHPPPDRPPLVKREDEVLSIESSPPASKHRPQAKAPPSRLPAHDHVEEIEEPDTPPKPNRQPCDNWKFPLGRDRGFVRPPGARLEGLGRKGMGERRHLGSAVRPPPPPPAAAAAAAAAAAPRVALRPPGGAGMMSMDLFGERGESAPDPPAGAAAAAAAALPTPSPPSPPRKNRKTFDWRHSDEGERKEGSIAKREEVKDGTPAGDGACRGSRGGGGDALVADGERERGRAAGDEMQIDMEVDMAVDRAPVAVPPAITAPVRVVLLGSSIDEEMLKTMKQACELMPGTVVMRWTPSVTHLVVAVDDQQRVINRTMKYFMALLGSQWIVTTEWLEASLHNKRWMPEEPFVASGDLFAEGGPRKSRQWKDTNHPNCPKRLLKGLAICCDFYELSSSVPKAEDINQVARLAGAIILKRPAVAKRKANAPPPPDSPSSPRPRPLPDGAARILPSPIRKARGGSSRRRGSGAGGGGTPDGVVRPHGARLSTSGGKSGSRRRRAGVVDAAALPKESVVVLLDPTKNSVGVARYVSDVFRCQVAPVSWLLLSISHLQQQPFAPLTDAFKEEVPQALP